MALWLSLFLLLISSCTCLYRQNGFASFLPQYSSEDGQTYHWIGLDYFDESNFTVVVKEKKAGCPNVNVTMGSQPIDNVFCGDELHHHWPHTIDHLYPCTGFFQRYPRSRWVMFSPNLPGHLRARIELFNITFAARLPPPACTHDIIIKEKKEAHRWAWHNEGGGPNFLSASSANAYRDTLLRSAEARNLTVRRGPPLKSTPHAGHMNLTVGIINRYGSRRILNFDFVRDSLAAVPDFRVVEINDMSEVGSFLQQCQLLNTLDIVVTSHGAQLVNLACAAPCTVVVELFPKNYFVPGCFDPWMLSMGHVVYGIYSGKDAYAETDPCCADALSQCCRASRASKVTAPSVFSKLVPALSLAHRRCCRHTKCWH